MSIRTDITPPSLSRNPVGQDPRTSGYGRVNAGTVMRRSAIARPAALLAP
ncbi:hypothetical protein [Streptomyces sp. NPDC001933]